MPCADTQSKSVDVLVLDHFRQATKILCGQLGDQFRAGKLLDLTLLKWYRDHRYLDVFGSFGYGGEINAERILSKVQFWSILNDREKIEKIGILIELIQVMEAIAALDPEDASKVHLLNGLKLEARRIKGEQG